MSIQRQRAGVRADTLFSFVNEPSGVATESERYDAAFLLAYLPLADIAYMTGEDILENVRLAQQARREFSWGSQLSDELYTHFVLPHRVSQEPFVHWRRQFIETLAPRVKNLTMTEAALEVNHWCHEVATYEPSDGRDQDPLTTIRAGLGRCEEEMILAICALRSVGLPARPCYTPFWAHQDDNHAWVEVWADGKWHYFGACEPDVRLNQAWFTEAARRAMLVVTTVYGDYRGSEPVLQRYGGSTLINSTAVYGPTRDLEVILLDSQGKPAAQRKLFFNLYNYGTFLPSMALETDSSGRVNLVCGPGDWFVTAGDGEHALFAHLKGNTTRAMLRLSDTKDMRRHTAFDFDPPPEPAAGESVKGDSLFACRLQSEDSLREANMWTIWATEAGVTPLVQKPDSAWVYTKTDSLLPDSSQQKLLEILRKSRGNWGNLWHVALGGYPGHEAPGEKGRIAAALDWLGELSEKDCRDFTIPIFDDRAGTGFVLSPEGMLSDSVRMRQIEYVLAPRISYEPSRTWRRMLSEFKALSSNSRLASIREVDDWLLANITVEDPKDRLGPPLTPAECLLLRRGAQDDLERLYLGFMRVNGVPARFSPVTRKPEIWQNGDWQIVELKKTPDAKPQAAKAPKTGKLVITSSVHRKTKEGGANSASAASRKQLTGSEQLAPHEQQITDSLRDAAPYNKMWAVSRWDKERFTSLDFGYLEPMSKMEWPQELPAGLYCLSSGIRAKDGSVPVHTEWFEIKPGKTTKVELKFR